MNTLELIEALTKYPFTRRIFCGVFSIDLLPQKRFSRPCCFIINTDPSNKAGNHWFSIFLPKFGPIEYFDSFGIQPINQEVYEFIKLNGGKWIFNNFQIQSNSTATCGKFCILFILYRARGMKFRKFLELFRPDKTYNEIFVDKLFEKMFN
jgi:hypothetical protein